MVWLQRWELSGLGDPSSQLHWNSQTSLPGTEDAHNKVASSWEKDHGSFWVTQTTVVAQFRKYERQVTESWNWRRPNSWLNYHTLQVSHT